MHKPTHRWQAAVLGASAALIALGLAGVLGYHPTHLLTGVSIGAHSDTTGDKIGTQGQGTTSASTSTSTPTSTSSATSTVTSSTTTTTTPTSAPTVAHSGKNGETDQKDENQAGEQTDQGDQNDENAQLGQSGHNDTGANADHQFEGQE